MENERYAVTLADVPAEIVGIRQAGVPYGYGQRRTEPGFLLADGTALLEGEKDENGFYLGGVGMDGMYLKTGQRYEPVRDEDGRITAFRRMSEHLPQFTGEEQKLIFQYAMNTKEHLLADLEAPLRVLKDARLRALFSGTREKLAQIPTDACTRLMADIRAAYKGRSEQSIRERQRAAHKPAKKRSAER